MPHTPAFHAQRCWVLSDLHLNESRPDDFHALITILENATRERIPVICGGDFFDLFLGWSGCLTPQQRTLQKLLTRFRERGLRFYWIEGNRDFRPHIWADVCAAITRELVWTIGDRRFAMVHGDRLNRRDWRHRAWLAVAKSRPALFLPRLMPPTWVHKIATFCYRHLHRYTRPRYPDFSWDPIRQALIRLGRRLAADVVLFGHYHRWLRFHLDDPIRGPLIGYAIPSWDEFPLFVEFNVDGTVVPRHPDGRPLDLEPLPPTAHPIRKSGHHRPRR